MGVLLKQATEFHIISSFYTPKLENTPIFIPREELFSGTRLKMSLPDIIDSRIAQIIGLMALIQEVISHLICDI